MSATGSIGRWLTQDLSIENLVFSAGSGFLFGAVAGYAIKKVVKIAAIVIGLFVVGLSYLSYRGCINVKWIEMEDATKATLTSRTCAN
ncbi:FUN14 domain-containing protein [Nitrososphaera sp. AFS]|uniref:FUN14 domain-containing protein n=1 Tax=Nitrososphaera sp. AFS TaxID=2301191 RepID=UPI0013922FF6|nr:FUN14 domain-containing protein [Nitrososphaera sp. AFS]